MEEEQWQVRGEEQKLVSLTSILSLFTLIVLLTLSTLVWLNAVAFLKSETQWI